MSDVNVYELLRKRFPQGEYALMQEVSDAAGFSRSRSLDFMAVALWESRGLNVIGIEMKSFRSDWLRELKNPKKQENHFKHCDYFWLLTTKDDVAKLEEIPDTWGWMCVEGKKLVTKKAPPKLNPLPVSKTFLAAILKRASDKTGWIERSQLQEQIKLEIDHAKQTVENDYTYRMTEFDSLKKKVEEFESISGVSIRFASWRMGNIAKAVGVISSGGYDKHLEDLRKLQTDAERVLEKIKEGLSNLPEKINNDDDNN